METWVLLLIVAVILFVAEMVTPGAFFFACLGLGAFVTALVSLLKVHPLVLLGSFLGSSVVFILVARPLARKFLVGTPKASNVDELIGKEGLVTEPIAPHRSGMVKLRGEVWKAESSEEILPDAVVEILKIEGNHLVVRKK